jgi:hypothetical protein
MNSDDKITTLFDKIPLVISEMVKKYGIKENSEKSNPPKLPKKSFIVKNSKDYFQNKITESVLISLLKENLGVSEEVAKEMFIDIKNKLIPIFKNIPALAGKNSEVKIENTEKKELDIFPNVNVQPEIASQITPPLKQSRSKSVLPKKIKPVIEEKSEEIISKPIQPKGPDSYREPIA